jgi:hypothetical protein
MIYCGKEFGGFDLEVEAIASCAGKTSKKKAWILMKGWESNVAWPFLFFLFHAFIRMLWNKFIFKVSEASFNCETLPIGFIYPSRCSGSL